MEEITESEKESVGSRVFIKTVMGNVKQGTLTSVLSLQHLKKEATMEILKEINVYY